MIHFDKIVFWKILFIVKKRCPQFEGVSSWRLWKQLEEFNAPEGMSLITYLIFIYLPYLTRNLTCDIQCQSQKTCQIWA